MSKLSGDVLNRISENNNDYRNKLHDLNVKIDELSTSIVSDIVTLSNYNVDFSNMIASVKERLVAPISNVIESYVIKDLRIVESVNEQFVEKINDKIDSTELNTREDKENFINSLDELLNDKYLEIVKIKRVEFLDNGTNSEIEEIVNNFSSELIRLGFFEEDKLNEVFNGYKNNIYTSIKETLKSISDLYSNNFSSEVRSSLSGLIDVTEVETPVETVIPPIDLPIPEPEEIEEPQIDIPYQEESYTKEEEPTIPEPAVEEVREYEKPVLEEVPYEAPSYESVNEEAQETPTKPIDVEEILKIAKSPVLSMPSEERTPYVEPIKIEEQEEKEETSYNERELVEEMIKRLKHRLELIDEKEAKLLDEDKKLDEDEKFVNNLIESSNAKTKELENLEKELNEKEILLNQKEEELNKKIKSVMPFANAVLETEKES